MRARCLAAALAAVLAGCTDSGPVPSCPDGFARCERVGSELHLSGIRMECDENQPSGLLVTETAASMVVSDASITGCHQGLMFHGPSCPGCTLTIRDSVLDIKGRGPFDTAISLGVWGHLRIENVTIRTQGKGWGLGLSPDVTTLHVQGSSFVHGSPEPGSTSAIVSVRAVPPTVEIVGTKISGYSTCLAVFSSDIRILDSDISGCGTGAILVGDRIDVQGSSFSGNEVGAKVVASSLEPAGMARADLSSLRFENNTVALDVSNSTQVQATSLTFVGNGVGVKVSTPVLGQVTASSFSGNGLAFDTGGLAFDARGNWWGAETGPTLLVQGVRTPGEGDAVTSGVEFVPFLAEPPARRN